MNFFTYKSLWAVLGLLFFCQITTAQDPAPKPSEPAAATAEPAATPAPKSKPAPSIPQVYGDRTGQVYIGHRAVVDRYAGWGWIWKQGEGYRRGKWVLLEEEPGVHVAPGRFLSNPEADNDTEYRLYGEFANYKGYEPNYDVFVDVFRIKGFEVIGKAHRPNLRPPSPSGKSKGSAFSRPREVDIGY